MASEKNTTVSLCPSPHLSAADLNGDTDVTIKSHDWQLVGKEKQNRGVLYFEEFERGLVVNRTNIKTIVKLHGNVLNDLIGKRITIYPTETEFEGNTVPCIRIRSKVPAAAVVKHDERAKQSA